MIFATRDIKGMDEFLKIFFMMVTNLNYHLNSSKEFKEVFRNNMEGQFGLDLYNKSFSNKLVPDVDEKDTLQQRIKWWMLIIDRGGPIYMIIALTNCLDFIVRL